MARAMVRIGLVAAAANLGLMALLVPGWGLLGATVATSVSRHLGAAPGAYFASKLLGGAAPDVRRLPAIILAAALMALPVALVAATLPAHVALAVGIPLGVLLYPPLLVLGRGIGPDDLARVQEILARLPTQNGAPPRVCDRAHSMFTVRQLP